MGSPAKLTFLGHASYYVDHGSSRLLVDPWVDGPAFDNGWDLLLPSARFDPASITHLWFSHEHPDHFSIPAVKSIPKDRRAAVQVVFQRTNDERVVGFLRAQGFTNIREVTAGERIDLGEGASLTTVPLAGEGDSCHLLDLDGFRILNFNDCFYRAMVEVEDVMRIMRVEPGSIDLMLTQFSYANWVGNVDEPEKRRAFARYKLDHLAMQVRAVRPRYTMPFASFIYFSHVDNAYLNDSANPPSRAAARVRDAGAIPILARPGDEIDLSRAGLEAASALANPRGRELDEAFAAVQRGERPWRTSAPVPLDKLVSTIHAGLERLRNGVSRADAAIMRLQLPRAAFALSDVPLVVVIDRLERVSLFPANSPNARPDVVLSSEALSFAFAQDFGFDTLLVNGRFKTARRDGVVAVMKLCGQFGCVRRKTSLVRDIVRRRLYEAPRRVVERLRRRALEPRV